MIVKNESSCVEKALESVKDTDEIIIIDTGSTDNTVELCKKYTDKVYSGEEYNWRDDFAFSRNQSLEKCTGDWVFIIDADEVLEKGGLDKLRKIIKEHPNEKGITVQAWNNQGHYFNVIRAFKRTPEVKWFGRVHNYLNVYDYEGYPSDIKFVFSTSLAHLQDPDRQIRILQLCIRENPKVGREKYYLGCEYYGRNEYHLAIYYLEWYIETSTFPAEMEDAIMTLSYAYYNVGNYKKSEECCLRAIAMNPNFKEALKFMETSHSGPEGRKRWAMFRKTANNDGVFIVREL